MHTGAPQVVGRKILEKYPFMCDGDCSSGGLVDVESPGKFRVQMGVSMNIVRLSILFFVTVFAAVPAAAGESVEEVTGNPSNAVMADDWGTAISAKMEEYLRQDADGNARGWQLGRHESNPSGGYIGWGEAAIQTDPADPAYGRARNAAYSMASTNAMAEFARTMSVDIGVETVNQSFSDESGAGRIEARTTDSLLKALDDRMSTLSVAALDRALEELGADPGQLPDYSLEEKHLLAENLLSRTIVTETAARIRGVRTLATFEDEGNVGVLIIHHARLERLADRILSGAAASPKGGDASGIRAKVDALSDTDLVFQQGVRILTDSEGMPVVLSFGQSSPAVTNADSDRRIRLAISRSRQVAEAQADGAIAEFLNSTVFAASEVNTLASEYQYVERAGRSLVRDEGAEFFEDINNMIRQTARAEISGVTTIRRWQENHPDTGHLYVGLVRMWTPAQDFEFSGQVRASVPDSADMEDSETPAEKVERERKVRQSKDLSDGD